MRRTRSVLPAIALLLLLNLFQIEGAHSQNRRGYFPEDWVTYTNMRFVTSIAAGRDDIYFGSTGGIAVFNTLENRWKDPITESDGLVSSEIWRVAYDDDNREVWVESPAGIYRYIEVFQEWYPESDFPNSLNQPNLANRLEFSTFSPEFGYSFLAENSEPFLIGPNLRNYRIIDAVEDYWNRLWVGTFGNGAFEVDLASNFMTLRTFGLYQDNVETIHVDGDDVWFGGRSESSDNAITRWDRENDR